MRHWFLILMIALLPVRGWALGTMTGQMPAAHAAMTDATVPAAAQVQTGASEATGAGHHTAAGMKPDCPEHAGSAVQPEAHHAPEQDSGAVSSEASADCHSCTSCQICHTVAATASAALPALTFSPHALPSLAGARFASAQPAPGLKPPIS